MLYIWSGRRDWLDFYKKNLRRCVGFFRRYSRLAKPPCQTRFPACSHLIARNLQTKKTTRKGGKLMVEVSKIKPKKIYTFSY